LAGSDDTGNGSAASPLKTVLKALETKGENIKVVVKKDAEGYKDVSGAALKKAKKTLVEQQRKLKKQEEQKQKQDEELKKKAEEEAKALERAKAIVLTQDSSLPKAEKASRRRLKLERSD
jgi:asparaginyl-tRNA synthetase